MGFILNKVDIVPISVTKQLTKWAYTLRVVQGRGNISVSDI